MKKYAILITLCLLTIFASAEGICLSDMFVRPMLAHTNLYESPLDNIGREWGNIGLTVEGVSNYIIEGTNVYKAVFSIGREARNITYSGFPVSFFKLYEMGDGSRILAVVFQCKDADCNTSSLIKNLQTGMKELGFPSFDIAKNVVLTKNLPAPYTKVVLPIITNLYKSLCFFTKANDQTFEQL